MGLSGLLGNIIAYDSFGVDVSNMRYFALEVTALSHHCRIDISINITVF